MTEETPMKKQFVLAAAFSLAFLMRASAAECVLHVKRMACAGQETESFTHCDGTAECDVTEAAASTDAACAKAALDACENKRLDITKSKVVTATFKSAALTGGFGADGKADAKGANFCGADRDDMNKCK
jgi:hypothetical protein